MINFWMTIIKTKPDQVFSSCIFYMLLTLDKQFLKSLSSMTVSTDFSFVKAAISNQGFCLLVVSQKTPIRTSKFSIWVISQTQNFFTLFNKISFMISVSWKLYLSLNKKDEKKQTVGQKKSAKIWRNFFSFLL